MAMKSRSSSLIYNLCLGALFVILLACSNRKKLQNDNQVFRYNEHSNISSLDPAFAKQLSDIWAINQLFNGLVQLDDELNVKPDIAKKWSISENGKSYMFTLRNDVYFHKHKLFGIDSTRIVNAHDFDYSFKRLINNDIASPGGWVLQNVTDFGATSDTTFVVNLKKPFPPFLGLLTMKYCSVVPKEAVDYFGNSFRSNPIGTGPFKFKLWVENTKLVLRKNNHYHEKDIEGRQLPYLEAVSITFLPDKQSEFLQLVQGNIDFLSGLDPSFKDDIINPDGNLSERYKDKLTMESGDYLNTEYLGILMDSDNSEVSSINIRKAINYGFDRQKMIQYLRNGIGTPAVNGFIPKGLPSFSNFEGYSYQPDKAIEYINLYKSETGNLDPEITITTNSQYVDLCEYIQRELEKIGLIVHVDVVPPSTLRQSKSSGKLPIFRASWVADYPDAENYLSLFYSKNFAPNGPNYMHYKNEKFDKLYEKVFVTTNKEERYKLYQQMDSLIIEDAPIVPLYYDQFVRFTQKNIRGLSTNPINLLNLKKVSKVLE
jgi:peptide/nickel transport system substrate-binding protein